MLPSTSWDQGIDILKYKNTGQGLSFLLSNPEINQLHSLISACYPHHARKPICLPISPAELKWVFIFWEKKKKLETTAMWSEVAGGIRPSFLLCLPPKTITTYSYLHGACGPASWVPDRNQLSRRQGKGNVSVWGHNQKGSKCNWNLHASKITSARKP